MTTRRPTARLDAMTVNDHTTRPDQSSPNWLVKLLQGTIRDSAYLLSTFPVALVSFIVLVTGICLGIGLAIIWVGVPILAGTLLAGRGFASLERTRLRVQGTAIDWTEPPPSSGSMMRKLLATLSDAGLWREALHGILALPISVATWSLTLSWWTLTVAGLTGWIWEPLSGNHAGSKQLMQLLDWPISAPMFDLIVGLFALLTLPLMVRVCAAAHVGLGVALLGETRQSLHRRVAQLSQARDQLGKAESESLRRLERDLHDGPQQTLIRLGMDLAAAGRRLDEGDVSAASNLVSGARTMTDSVIADLRALSRSIAPPVLTERGLGAALIAAAATSSIPVALHYQLTVEPPEAIATPAYYVVCEGLANAVKHSGATSIDVFVSRDDANLRVQVSDNGSGGAVAVPGHGLAGLRDRVEARDGTWQITSDTDSGTTLVATWPWEMSPQNT